MKHKIRRLLTLVVVGAALVAIAWQITIMILHPPKAIPEGLRTLDNQPVNSVSEVVPDNAKLIFLLFWSTSCGACQDQMDALDKVDSRGGQIALVAVNVGESRSTVKEFLKAHNISDKVIVLLGGPMPPDGAIPYSAVAAKIDGQWQALGDRTGFVSTSDIQNVLDVLLEEMEKANG